MQTTSIRLYSYNYNEVRTYLTAALFVVGNIVLPQLCHLMPQGGFIWLPIYFFTLVGAYKYGWKVGLLTAIASLVVNSLLFGMPAVAVLPAILVKSVILALAAGFAASYFRKSTFLIFAGVVLTYQVLGTLVEWAICGDFMLALKDFYIGIPGLLVQIFGGKLFVQYIIRK